MSFEIEGIEQIKLKLQRLNDVPQIADEELKKCAEDLADKARAMAPVDYGDLKEAIQVARRGAQGAGGRFVKGISNYEVLINNRHPVSDPFKQKYGTDYVGEYAWYVHEHMGWGSNSADLMPSDKSIAAGAAAGVEAGGKFLERALEDMRDEIGMRLAQAVRKHIK